MWTKHQEKLLEANKDRSISDLARILNKSEAAVRNKKSKMGLGAKKESWTDTEYRILQKYYGKVSKSEMLELLPNRTWLAITRQVSNLRQRGWVIGEG